MTTLGEKGCDPNYIGVQEYGSITGRVIDAKTNLPLSGGYVNVGSLYVTHTDAQGAFTLPKVPVGTQEVTISATGYKPIDPIKVLVAKDKASVIDEPVALTPIAGSTGTQTPAPSPTPTR